MKTKLERLEAKIARIKEMFPNPTPGEARQIEAALEKAEAQLKAHEKQPE